MSKCAVQRERFPQPNFVVAALIIFVSFYLICPTTPVINSVWYSVFIYLVIYVCFTLIKPYWLCSYWICYCSFPFGKEECYISYLEYLIVVLKEICYRPQYQCKMYVLSFLSTTVFQCNRRFCTVFPLIYVCNIAPSESDLPIH